ncbi:MAG: hypothetical protein CMN30_22665 [Sandaracinus sp.]|nr:hypothetical protein [Sandaracinus sp.]
MHRRSFLVDATHQTRSLLLVMSLTTRKTGPRAQALPAPALPIELIVGLLLLALIIGRAGTGTL